MSAYNYDREVKSAMRKGLCKAPGKRPSSLAPVAGSRKRRKLTFRETIEWIAENDEPTDTDRDSVVLQISVALVADMLGRPAADIADRVVTFRETGRHLADRRVLIRSFRSSNTELGRE